MNEILKLIKTTYNNKSLKEIHFLIGVNFENAMEKILNFIDISSFLRDLRSSKINFINIYFT